MPRKSKPISPEATSDDTGARSDSIPTTIATEEIPIVKKPVRKNKKEELRSLIEEIVLENLSRLKIIYI